MQWLEAEFNVWYLDDGTIGDSPEKVISCIRGLIVDLREMGLEFNLQKCELTLLNHTRDEALQTEEMFRELLPELEIVPISNASVLEHLVL